MSEQIMTQHAALAGWTTESQLALCLEYISRQQDDPTFEDFLEQQVAQEGDTGAANANNLLALDHLPGCGD